MEGCRGVCMLVTQKVKVKVEVEIEVEIEIQLRHAAALLGMCWKFLEVRL